MSDRSSAAKVLTIMMTDIVGSTALWRARGDPNPDDIFGSQAEIVHDKVITFGGRVHKSLGDGFLISFPSTDAAVSAAVAIQRTLHDYNSANPDRAVEIRIGIHLGRVAESDGDLLGQAVHVAARVMAEAASGQILTTGEVRKRAEPHRDYSFLDSGLFWLRGFPERWRLYEVSWSDTSAGARSITVPALLTPLVEREAERATLRQLLDDALVGHGKLALVAGEPGVGKSRLVAEIGNEAQARGMRVLTGHCVEMSGAPPYLPYVEIIEQAISNPRSPLALRQSLGDVAAEIARIAPALRRVFPDIPPPVELPPELARRYVWNSLGEFMGRAAEGQPLLLVLEDLHWADESTVLLTEYLAPLLPEMSLLVLGTYRDIEVDLDHPLARVIGQLARRYLVERVSLRRLSYDGVRAILQALAGQVAPEQLVRLIDRETEGNPFFIEEVYLHLVESGVLLDEHGRVRADLQLDEVSVPESIRLVLGQRLDRLAESTREVLVAAAVSGRVFASEIVGEIAGASKDTLVEAFDEAERSRLISPGKAAGELIFGHELIRQTLLSGVSAVKRERLHLRTAQAVSRRYSEDLDAHAGDLAYHLSRAGRSADRASLVRYLTIAGDRAFDAAAFDDAVGHFEHALSLIPVSDQLGRAQLLERLAMALRSVGRWEDALSTMNDALDRYEALGRAEDIGRLGWAMVYQLTWNGQLIEAVAVCRRAMAPLGDTASADKARLLSALGRALSASGDYAAAVAMFDQARALAEQVGNERALADVLHMQTAHHFGYAEFAKGVSVGLRAGKVFEQERALWDLCSVQAFVIYEDGSLGSREQSSSLADKTLGIAERLGHHGAAFLVLMDRIRQAAMLCDLPQVEVLGPQILDIGERGGLPYRYIGHVYLGLAAHWRGNAERAEAQLRNAVELEPPGAFAGQSGSLLARHLAYQGRADEVMGLFESAQSQSKLPRLDRVNGIGSWSCMLGFVEAFYLCGLYEQAASLAPLVEGLRELGGRWITYDGRLLETRAGLVAAATRRWEEAEREFAIASDIAEQMSNRLELADLRRLHARMLLDRGSNGDYAPAAEMLEEALSAYRTFGIHAYAADAERLLSQAHVSRAALPTMAHTEQDHLHPPDRAAQ
ncbi:MAG TPA: AAA family ATPase [Propionibacteriaceae bacterium]|nr:AAA family ATPase [Propionibacteriaceae bacterium]